MTTTQPSLADQAEALAVRELREAREPAPPNPAGVPQPHQWRNLVLAISLGMDTRPLAGAVGTRMNGERRLAAAFGPEKEPK